MIPIYEDYKNYTPPRYARSTIARLLSDLPEQYQAGLQSVVLTNAETVGKGQTIRVQGRRHLRSSCRGFYHPKWKGQKPWIEVVVDNVARNVPRGGRRIPCVRDIVFARVLFHEVGHHLDVTMGSPARGGEAPAETWSKRLTIAFLRKRYWYLVPLLRLVRAVLRRLGLWRSRSA